MPIKAVLFDMFDTLMMIRKNHEFYSPSLMRMYKYLNKNGVNVSFDTFQKAYIKSRDELYAKADAKFRGAPLQRSGFRNIEKFRLQLRCFQPRCDCCNG